MESFQGHCPHRSMPVETDESMTSSSLNLAWPTCQQCQSHNSNEAGKIGRFGPEMCVCNGSRLDYLDSYCGLTPKVLRVSPFTKPSISDSQHTASPAGLPSLYLPQSSGRHLQRDCRDHIEDLSEDFSGINIQNCLNSPVLYPHARNLVSEDEESLEKPSCLRSDLGENFCRFSPPKQTGFYDVYPPEVLHHWHKQPANYPRPNYPLHQLLPEHARYAQNRPIFRQEAVVRPPQVTSHQSTAPVRELMSEVSVQPSQPAAVGQLQTQKRISLPDDCRDVFITYSVDTAAELIPFVSFLNNQGFRPAIDIFEDRVRELDINKWMDSFLKNKSVLIIVVISPKYKMDVEGDGCDQHGLHTKYIHTQIQNEFILQRCLNFRLVPVLFPSANQSHVPLWLQSTRLYRWPEDAKDLLLRLLREEKYIVPPLGKELTLTIKPL
ncbi:E3 ubiquitin ligase TRAF3IP2 [Pimephales promelas]|uniref:E3 ubiquitin ligase TRAF3IP2 n=1 Tax=Pimephales promelas TaxID=90988 RepID=UPI001955C902|nr:E3 ubiquitin ligase TRAF3IP2 [Pimephales promelas]KAG1928725.1 adapter protein CIKS [Pimephales promelas]